MGRSRAPSKISTPVELGALLRHPRIFCPASFLFSCLPVLFHLRRTYATNNLQSGVLQLSAPLLTRPSAHQLPGRDLPGFNSIALFGGWVGGEQRGWRCNDVPGWNSYTYLDNRQLNPSPGKNKVGKHSHQMPHYMRFFGILGQKRTPFDRVEKWGLENPLVP